MRIIIIAIATLFFMYTPNAQANTHNHEVDRIMNRVDRNNNGRISLKEARLAKGYVFNNFRKIDINNNGFITRQELKAHYAIKRRRN